MLIPTPSQGQESPALRLQVDSIRRKLFCTLGYNSGRGSAWLERLVRDQEVEGSNPFAPTIFSFHGFLSELKRILNCFGDAACAGFGASVVENAEQVPAPA